MAAVFISAGDHHEVEAEAGTGTMCDHWMPTIKLPLTAEQFALLPRNPAYRYEYVDGGAILTPRARHYHALLDLKPMEVPETICMERITGAELPGLAPLFADVFRAIQPYGSLDEPTRRRAVLEALERTRNGGDGPWIERASFVTRHQGEITGAILITLLPEGDPCSWESYYWPGRPPENCVELRLGRPHLTWVFVSPLRAGQGVGSGLLARAARELREMGFTQLLSTFMMGNDSSLLWHWRNGFRLLAHPSSVRRLHRPARAR